jgi:hypothetical protein
MRAVIGQFFLTFAPACSVTHVARPDKRRVGRGSRIRTGDLQYPKLPRYQTALYPAGSRNRIAVSPDASKPPNALRLLAACDNRTPFYRMNERFSMIVVTLRHERRWECGSSTVELPGQIPLDSKGRSVRIIAACLAAVIAITATNC